MSDRESIAINDAAQLKEIVAVSHSLMTTRQLFIEEDEEPHQHMVDASRQEVDIDEESELEQVEEEKLNPVNVGSNLQQKNSANEDQKEGDDVYMSDVSQTVSEDEDYGADP